MGASRAAAPQQEALAAPANRGYRTRHQEGHRRARFEGRRHAGRICGGIGGAQLAHEVGDVAFDGASAQVEEFGHLLVGEAEGDGAAALELTGGEDGAGAVGEEEGAVGEERRQL